MLRVHWVDVLERKVLDRLCIGAGNVVVGALSIDTSGGGREGVNLFALSLIT